jgi:hypothetical protein
MMKRMMVVVISAGLLGASCQSAPQPAPEKPPAADGSKEGHAAQAALLKSLLQNTAAVLKVGMQAQQAAAPPCEQGHAGLLAMTAELQRLGVKDVPAPPSRSDYLASCGALPAELQACLRIDRLINQATDCDAALNKVGAKEQESFGLLAGRRLFKGP